MRCGCLRFLSRPLSFLSLNVLPAARYDTCDASSRQRSHWCCWPSCAQVQLFIDWGWQSKYTCCFRLLLFCRCEQSHVIVCPVVTVECDSACSQHLCRFVCDRYFAHAINNWIMLYGIYIRALHTYVCTFDYLLYIFASSVNLPCAFSLFRMDGMLSTWLQTVVVSAPSSTLHQRWSLSSTPQPILDPVCSTWQLKQAMLKWCNLSSMTIS